MCCLTPIFGRKKEPKEIFDENMKKANELWESPKLWKSSEYKKLLKHIEKAQEIAETVKADQEHIVRLWSMKGSVFWMGYHRLGEALKCYDRALSINPRDFESSFNRLQVRRVFGEAARHIEPLEVGIVEDCDKVLDLIPERRGEKIYPIPGGLGFETWDQCESMLWAQKGEALSYLARFKEASRCYDKSLKLNPSNVRAWTFKAICYLNLEKWHEAIDSCDKAIELEPKNIFAWCNKGVALSQLGRYEEALRCYDRALEIDPKDSESLSNKAGTLIRLDKPKEAIKCCDKALRISLRDPVAWYNRGLALAHLGKFKDAIKCYDRALEIHPRYARVWYDKGVALDSMARHGEAKECFSKAVEIDPSFWDKVKSLSEQP